jgi:hypothetical protein
VNQAILRRWRRQIDCRNSRGGGEKVFRVACGNARNRQHGENIGRVEIRVLCWLTGWPCAEAHITLQQCRHAPRPDQYSHRVPCVLMSAAGLEVSPRLHCEVMAAELKAGYGQSASRTFSSGDALVTTFCPAKARWAFNATVYSSSCLGVPASTVARTHIAARYKRETLALAGISRHICFEIPANARVSLDSARRKPHE